MSAKPPKKSDAEKSWMSPRVSKNIPLLPEHHLIVTEGTKTEPQYFEAIKTVVDEKCRNFGSNRIQIKVNGTGKNTTFLVDEAKRIVDETRRSGGEEYKHVWLVYDKDDFPKDRFNEVVTRCEILSDEQITYHALWSNQCIELWFLWHFIPLEADILRDDYSEKLTEHLKNLNQGEYKKNRTDMFEILSPYKDTAIATAKRLMQKSEGIAPAACAPGTKVYEIIEKLNDYL